MEVRQVAQGISIAGGGAAVRKLEVGLERCNALAEATLVSYRAMWVALGT